LLLIGGCGLVLLTVPSERQTTIIETLCFSLLLGAGLVSLSSFAFGYLVSGQALRLTISALCLTLFVLGWRKNRPTLDRWSAPPKNNRDWLLLGAALALICLAFWFSKMRTLGWDGLLNWEIKARIAFLSGGSIPLNFFSDPTRFWSHQEYPLLLPLTEAWMYSWMGRADQGMIKILFPILFMAAIGLLFVGVSRDGLRPHTTPRLWLALALLTTAKVIIVGEGSMASGYADFPMAVFYLGAVILLLEFCEDGGMRVARLFGLVAGFLCWVKVEGAILWICLVSLAVIHIIQRRAWRNFVPIVFPGLTIVIGWRIFLFIVNRSTGQDFLPLTLTTLRNNLWRVPHIALAALHELLRWRRWGILWIAVAAVTVFLIFNRRQKYPLILPATVILPILLYASVYLFSAWDFLLHMDNSFPRLLSHVSLAAVLMVSVATPIGRMGLQARAGIVSGRTEHKPAT
jgi:hypothetical protein